MKIAIFSLLIWSLSLTNVSGSDNNWNTGYVIMPDGRRIEGQLNYNWKAEVLQVKLSDGTLRAYSAGRINSFMFFDDAQNILRKFSTIAFAGSDDKRRFAFMEECTTGKLTVYRRLRHSHEFIKIGRPSMFGSDKELIKDYDNFTYLVLDDNQVTDLDRFGTDLWPQMREELGKPLTEYVKTRQLDMSSTVVKLILINQYNYLKIKAEEQSIADTQETTPTTEPIESVETAAGINSEQQ
jgi:hypothetical protein